jgi:hypothetical protein
MAEYTDLVEKLNQVLREFAFEVIRKKGLHVKPQDFHIAIAHTTTYTHFVESGSPVIIKFSFEYLVSALGSRDNADRIELTQHIVRSLEQVPRMLRTVALVPRRDVIGWRQEVRGWFTYKGDVSKLTRGVPVKDIVLNYIELIEIMHLPSDTVIIAERRSHGVNRALADIAMAALLEHLNERSKQPGRFGKSYSRTAGGVKLTIKEATDFEGGSSEDPPAII